MRVAVCISGELRTYKENYESLKKNILDPYDADVFLSSWNTTSAQDKYNNKITLPISKRELLDLYKPKGIKLYDFDESIFYEYKGVKIPDELIKVKPKSFRANIPQFFLMKDCNELKRKYELENNFVYDVVVRTRADLLIFCQIKLEKLDLNKINLKHIIKDTYYSDQFAISSSILIDSYTSVFNYLNIYWMDPLQDGQFKNILNGETLMRHHILHNELPHKRLWIKFPIIRFNESNLSKFKKIYLENFKNMIKIILKIR